MAIKFHLARFRPLCQLSKNILHIDSDFHTLSPWLSIRQNPEEFLMHTQK